MAGDFKFISKDELELTPYAREVVEAFEAIVAKCLPDETVNFAQCRNCANLHVYAARDKKPNGRMIKLDIPPSMYQLLTRQ